MKKLFIFVSVVGFAGCGLTAAHPNPACLFMDASNLYADIIGQYVKCKEAIVRVEEGFSTCYKSLEKLNALAPNPDAVAPELVAQVVAQKSELLELMQAAEQDLADFSTARDECVKQFPLAYDVMVTAHKRVRRNVAANKVATGREPSEQFKKLWLLLIG